MDTNTSTQNIAVDTALPTQSQTDTAKQQPEPVAPVSIGNKEHGPIGQVREYVSPHPAEASPELPPDVKEAGVEVVPSHEQPSIPEEARDAGVRPAKDAVPVSFEPQTTLEPTQPSVQLPTAMNYEEAKKESSGNPGNSKTWLAMLSKYVLEKFGMEKVI